MSQLYKKVFLENLSITKTNKTIKKILSRKHFNSPKKNEFTIAIFFDMMRNGETSHFYA